MTTLDNFRKQAKRWLKALRANDADARARLIRAFPKAPAAPGLRDVQHALAREHGHENWTALKAFAIAERAPQHARKRALDDAAVRLAAAAGEASADRPSPTASGELYTVSARDNRVRPRRILHAGEWDVLIDTMRAQRIAALDASGGMTDTALRRIAELEHITYLDLSGSREVTDEGLGQLARLPNLEHLVLTGCGISDRGLEVLRELPALRWLQICHHGGISDAGIAHLADCPLLEHVDLMNTPTGDGSIRALAGKEHLRFFKAGNSVTEAGVSALHQFPLFKTWRGGDVRLGLMSPDAGPTFLWLFLRAPSLNRGIGALSGLDGLFALSLHGGSNGGPFDSNTVVVVQADLAPLANLGNLGWLGLNRDLCDDEAMRHIGGMPHLRMLMGQGTIASDDGFEALGRSASIEYIWGRECPNLTGRGFVALSRMPALRGLAVSCKRVDDEALASLPRFPSLAEIMPMDVSDDGFHHVGRCEALEALWCMYCRDTTDQATEHIAGLTRLRTYYAGRTRITDRSLEILSRMPSLETLTFWQCQEITDRGLALIARLPRLREVNLEGEMPFVTLDGTTVFPPHVHLDYHA